jgi:hypothetical protein
MPRFTSIKIGNDMMEKNEELIDKVGLFELKEML